MSPPEKGGGHDDGSGHDGGKRNDGRSPRGRAWDTHRSEARMDGVESQVRSMSLSMRYQVQALGDAVRVLSETVERIDDQRRSTSRLLVLLVGLMLLGDTALFILLRIAL